MEPTDPADWVSQLILTHLDALTAQALAQARAQIPWHRAQPEARIRDMLAADYIYI